MLFSHTSGLDEDENINRQDVYLPRGKAIGSVWAGMCVKEMLRTKRFVRGSYLGIKEAMKRFPCRPVHVLYAGTGPFAALAMPLTTVFTSGEVGFTMLEINPQSIKSVNNVIQAFEAEKYVKRIIKCDAGEYNAEEIKPIHMIITETMQNALQKEPQVGITLNLVPQMEPEGVLIPQSIRIDAALMNYKKFNERMLRPELPEQDYCRVIDTVFEVSKDTAAYPGAAEGRKAGHYKFDAKNISIPGALAEEYRHLCLLTTIRVYGEEVLTGQQCSLTMPKRILSFEERINDNNNVSLRYVLSNNPGFECSIL
jgi:hypothetical protein